MKKRLMTVLGVGALLLMLTVGIVSPVAAGDNKAFRACGTDPSYPQLGTAEVLVNSQGAQFWWTWTGGTIGYLVDGHSYHEVWKWDVNNSDGQWAEMDVVGGSYRSPWNIPGHYGHVYYKTFDTTLGIQVAP